MELEKLQSIIALGENIHTEFKRCGNGIEKDVYETACAFANRFGGDILCGVLDSGEVRGLPKKAVPDLIKNITTVTANHENFNPPLYLTPEAVEIQGKTIIVIHVPLSSDVHAYKGKFYDRVAESDIVVKGNERIAEMIIRKQDIFTEQKIYPYATINELKPELITQCRQMAVNLKPDHPWKDMTDKELIQSAGLFRTDLETGKSGINRAGLLLLGRDDVVFSICPNYKTDALVRRVNLDRFDDREIVQKNLVESFPLLMQFAQKHLNDKFHLEGVQRVSLRDKIVREMISNVLMHREFTSPYVSKFVIESDRMYTENPCKAQNQFEITPENFTPVSKNPIIAKFFSNIGYADELGSGTRNLFHYTMLYSGERPKMLEDDIFRTIVPLHNDYSSDYGTPLPQPKAATQKKVTVTAEIKKLSQNQKNILRALRSKPQITQVEIAEKLHLSRSTVQNNIKELQAKGIIARIGSKKDGQWVVKK